MRKQMIIEGFGLYEKDILFTFTVKVEEFYFKYLPWFLCN